MGERWHMPSASATPWDGADESSLTPAQALVAAWQRDEFERLHDPSRWDEAGFLNAYGREACAWCGSPEIVRFGHADNGVRRWLCNGCGRTFTPATGTVFGDRKLPVTEWAPFLYELFSYESLAGISRVNRRSPSTVAYWMGKLFLVLGGIQDGVVLSGRVQADEMMYPVPAAEAEMGARGRKPGFSRNQTCVAIACEEGARGPLRSVFVRLGQGKPSGARAKAAYCPHVEAGSTLVHDKENSHNAVVRELSLVSEAYDSRVIKRLPDDENPLSQVNRLCFLLRLFLDGHTGFDRSNFDGWLDVFSVMMNPPEDRLAKVAMVLDRAMLFPNTLSYRGFYKQTPSSPTWTWE